MWQICTGAYGKWRKGVQMKRPILAEKETLTVEEAISLFNLSRRKFHRPTDKLPQGKKSCLSLRELEKQIGYDLDTLADPTRKSMKVCDLVERYLTTKVNPQVLQGR